MERRLARLRFDLHDGPQQDVFLLAQDLRLFRDQLAPMIAEHPDRDRMLGRLDDLEAQVVALDGGLRQLSSTAQSPFLDPGSFPDALGQVIAAFSQRTAIVADTELNGDFGALSESQQITLLSVIREALSNVRRHSAATEVAITVTAGTDELAVRVTDDGIGFDPATTLTAAAAAGHLGVVGMHERVRMLGGQARVESRPGGPTVVSATLPPWPGGLA